MNPGLGLGNFQSFEEDLCEILNLHRCFTQKTFLSHKKDLKKYTRTNKHLKLLKMDKIGS